MTTFQERKLKRIAKGALRSKPCSACNGYGYYDHNGSPKCGTCDGIGKITYYEPIKK